jgi:hypothetical protein
MTTAQKPGQQQLAAPYRSIPFGHWATHPTPHALAADEVIE